MLTRVFPGLVVTDAIGSDALRAWFANTRSNVSVRKLRLAIDHELKRAAWAIDRDDASVNSGREGTFEVRVRSLRRIVNAQPTSAKPELLPKGGTIAFARPMPNDSGRASVRIVGPACNWWQPPGGCGTLAGGYVHLLTTLEPEEELRRIGVDPTNHPDSALLNFRVVRGGALSAALYYPLAGLLVLTVGLLVMKLKWATHRPQLAGRLIHDIATGPGDSRNIEQVVHFKNLTQRSYSVRAADGKEIVRFEVRNERGASKMYVTPCEPNVRINGTVKAGEQRLDRPTRFETNHGNIQYFKN
jgi:hypothetical protein